MSTTPSSHQRPASRQRRPSSATRSRPTTPLRPPSRGSFRGSVSLPSGSKALPLEALEAQFAELSDGMADLEANFYNLGVMHESLARFSEDFASFLYGLNMNAFCVDFPEAPIPESFKRFANRPPSPDTLSQPPPQSHSHPADDPEATFLTNDTFIENPPSSRTVSKFETPAPNRTRRGGGIPTRGGSSLPRGRGGIPRGSGIPSRARGTGRGALR